MAKYDTRTDLKRTTGVDTSEITKKTDLASLKLEVDESVIDKSKAVPVDLSKLSNAVDNDIVKKTEYIKLATKVNVIDTSGFVLKTQYNTDKSRLEKKINNRDKKYLLQVNLLKK